MTSDLTSPLEVYAIQIDVYLYW